MFFISFQNNEEYLTFIFHNCKTLITDFFF